MQWRELMNGNSRPENPSRRVKIATFIVVWLVALYITDPRAKYWPLVYMFPLGLLRVFAPHDLPIPGPVALVGGWAVYIAHSIFYFRAKTSRSWLACAALLVLLLAVNVGGCRAMINTH